jgi:hypothetical protein
MYDYENVIQLWAMEPDFFGVLVPMPTGIRWSNQVGGTCCYHPEVEGLYVPLPISMEDREDVLLDWGSHHDYQGEGLPRIRSWLSVLTREGLDLDEAFEVRPTYPEGECWGEAWVPVRIKEEIGEEWNEFLAPFRGRDAFLIYPNSD